MDDGSIQTSGAGVYNTTTPGAPSREGFAFHLGVSLESWDTATPLEKVGKRSADHALRMDRASNRLDVVILLLSSRHYSCEHMRQLGTDRYHPLGVDLGRR